MGEGYRSDRKHRFALRIGVDDHNEIDALSFKFHMSLNFLYTEAIDWAMHHPDFHIKLEQDHGKRRIQKNGHFVYIKNTEV